MMGKEEQEAEIMTMSTIKMRMDRKDPYFGLDRIPYWIESTIRMVQLDSSKEVEIESLLSTYSDVNSLMYFISTWSRKKGRYARLT